MEVPRIGGLPTSHGIERLTHERRERRGKGSFQEAFEKQGGEHGKEQGKEQGSEHGNGQSNGQTSALPAAPARPPAATHADDDAGARVQETPGNGRREDEDGARHVDVLA